MDNNISHDTSNEKITDIKLVKDLNERDDIMRIRQTYHDFMRKNGYKYMPQSKVNVDDPTLFFVNSGMCQLKKVFLGEEDAKFKKLMNHQICIRCSGKHNDLDDVGKDSYHLTLFEMCGFWQLDDAYNREEVFDLTYNFLVNVCKLDKESMYVTYFKGDDNIPEDTESKELWKKYFPERQIIASSFKDNFWMMGDSGPCGRSVEIHYDLNGFENENSKRRDASALVNSDDPTVVELWNNVFIEYNKTEKGYEKLDKKYVDQGSGLERIAMAIQHKKSIYHTDAFKYLFGYAQSLTNADFYTDKYDCLKDKAYRIFVDHIRTVTVATYQGVNFDCVGRGAILRKIFRRMMTYMYLYLNDKKVEPIMKKDQIFGMIKQILNYFLFEIRTDADPKIISDIHNKFIEEEKFHIGKLQNIKIINKSLMKKYKDKTVVDEKMKVEYGIDKEFVQHIGDLVFQLE